ncbi:MAG: hypothetical protein NTV01_18545 [Bacteroidia bacterium]|nr:hypothetical protein [Bacteroidia bacterium]
MKPILTQIAISAFVTGFLVLQYSTSAFAQAVVKDTIIEEKLMYHPIHLNSADQTILPWYSSDLGKSYDFVIGRVWGFWDTMRSDLNGLPYYMNHQVWKPDVNDTRGVAGSQFEMALSSWRLLYQYTGNDRIKENMKFIADYYLSHGLSSSSAEWPDLPYPYNTLAKHTIEGNYSESPLPFKVNVLIGKAGKCKDVDGVEGEVQLSPYTTNWSGTMELFLNLIQMNKGQTAVYQKAFDTILAWMKQYPLQNNRWGPFFEDIPGWSDTQINAITFAQFMMNHPEYFPNWKSEVKGIFSWVYEKLGNTEWEKYGVIVVNEQTAYQTPGNSHSARQASAELQYAAFTGDTAFVKNAVRQLNWATYMVDHDGKNRYPRDDIWLSDGYGDYVRHFLRAMAFRPDLAPAGQNHVLNSSSVIQFIEYPSNSFKSVEYRTYDEKSTEIIRMAQKPLTVFVNRSKIPESDHPELEGWQWKPLRAGLSQTLYTWTRLDYQV